MTIPEQAVIAAMEHIHAADYNPDENDFLCMRSAIEAALPFLQSTERSCTCHPDDNPPISCAGKYALRDCKSTAAAPFLQGVKVDSMDTAPKNGDEFLARCGKEWPWFSCFWDGSAFVHYDHTDGIVHYPATEWIPIPKRMLALAPSQRAQALEEAARICDQSSTLSKEQQDKEQNPFIRNALMGEIATANMLAKRIRALSSQPVADHNADAGKMVADGWLPIETAPKDGTHCILCIKDGSFYYSVQGAFQDGKWNCVYLDNVQPLCWMPNVRIPAHFLPASPEVSG